MLADKVGSYLRALAGAILPDALLLGGLAGVTYGIALMSRPGAFIAAGAAAILLGLASGRKQ